MTSSPIILCTTAEQGCLQYFAGVSGKIMTYNYEPTMGLHLSNQDYSICIRSEQNFCSIQYSQCSDTGEYISPATLVRLLSRGSVRFHFLFARAVNNRSHSFALTGNTLGQNAVSSMVDANACSTDWLVIPCMENVDALESRTTGAGCVDRICGGTLSARQSATSSVISSKRVS